MNNNLLPFLKDLKTKINAENIEQAKQVAIATLKTTSEQLETKAKQLAENAKNNPKVQQAFNQYVTPVIQSEKTKTALNKLQEKFPNQALITKLDQLLKNATTTAETTAVENAKEATKVETENTTVAQ